MIYELDMLVANVYMNNKRVYDSFSRAIKLAKQNGVAEGTVNSLIAEKQRINVIRLGLEKDIQRLMAKESNLLRIQDSWWAVHYINDKSEKVIKVDILRESDLHLVERDPRKGNLHRRIDLDSILPAALDEQALELYKAYIERRAFEVLHDYGVHLHTETTPAVDNGRIAWSSHVRKRYAQRVLGIKGDNEAQEYQRVHIREIEDALDDRFGKAELMWEGSDGIQYWLDEENFMYVVGSNHAGVTMYEEDFGFTKEINRSIVLQQIEVVKEAHRHLTEAQDILQGELSKCDREVADIDGEIKVLQSQIEHLQAKRSAVSGKRQVATKNVAVWQERLNKESDKLFKKWDA